ncbi:MAG: sodium:solute symporter [Pseudomonadota bacterium]
MTPLDWAVLALYLASLLILALYLRTRLRADDDYFLGGRTISAGALATSTIATQCSTNSLLGAPAFVGFAASGGLLWLQYELALPLAMLALTFLLVPARRLGIVSIYAFLEARVGRGPRLLASATFLLFRGVATGVTVYGAALLLGILLDIDYTAAVLLLMAVTLAYDVLGGMRAVVASDVLQMVLIVVAVLVSIVMLAAQGATPFAAEPARLAALDFGWGMDGAAYEFWPMLIGGFFLYCAYYGCDQSQAQRLLAGRSEADTRRILLYNGLLRFPLVLLYCLLGLALAAYATGATAWLETLPTTASGAPNYNMVFPVYVLHAFPSGLTGLVMAGIFAAAMSSIDSALNALSAVTLQDFRRNADAQAPLWLCRLTTLGWGAFAVAFSYQIESIAPTVLEAINKTGSLANGPLLALFVIALLMPGVGQKTAIAAYVVGFIANLLCASLAPEISWLWWNALGCVAAVAVAALMSGARAIGERELIAGVWQRRGAATLLSAFAAMLAICWGFGVR